MSQFELLGFLSEKFSLGWSILCVWGKYFRKHNKIREKQLHLLSYGTEDLPG